MGDHFPFKDVLGRYFDAGSPGFAHASSPMQQPFDFPNFNQEENFQFQLPCTENTNQLIPATEAGNDPINRLPHQRLVGQAQPQGQTPTHQDKRSGAAGPASEDDSRERKKQIDKKYRDRLKSEKEQMKQQLDELRGENGSLKQESEELRGQNGMMSQKLESNAEHMKQLTNSHNQLSREFTRQESFVQALLHKLSPGNDLVREKQDNEKLRWKQPIVIGDVKGVLQIFEELLSENMKLKQETMILRVKVESLCEKIHNDKHQEESSADQEML